MFPIPNWIIVGDGFYVSYNNRDISIYGSDTTALVIGQMEHFFILNGDHRNQYKKLIPLGFEICMKYFLSHLDKINMYSEKP